MAEFWLHRTLPTATCGQVTESKPPLDELERKHKKPPESRDELLDPPGQGDSGRRQQLSMLAEIEVLRQRSAAKSAKTIKKQRGLCQP